MTNCKICNEEDCNSTSCRAAIDDVKKRINGRGLCLECKITPKFGYKYCKKCAIVVAIRKSMIRKHKNNTCTVCNVTKAHNKYCPLCAKIVKLSTQMARQRGVYEDGSKERQDFIIKNAKERINAQSKNPINPMFLVRGAISSNGMRIYAN